MSNQLKKILVVEDEAFIAMGLRMELTHQGYYQCDIVASGEEAVQLIEKEEFQLALMDIQLSGKMDGIEAARKISLRHRIPIVFMTGFPNQDLKERAKTINPIAWFDKPIAIEELKRVIEEAFTLAPLGERAG